MSTDVTAPPESEPAAPSQPAPSKKGRSPLRTAILIGILIVGIVALVFDRRAQSQAQQAHDAIFEMTRPGKELPTAEAVQAHLGREPAATYDHKQASNIRTEEYHYSVPWRKNVVYVYYKTQPEMRLVNVSLNEELSPDDL